MPMNTHEIVLRSDQEGGSVLRMYYSAAEAGRREYVAHHHTEIEISCLLSGRCEWQIRKRPFLCGKGDVVLLGSDEEHYITQVGEDEPLKLLNLRFEPRFIWSPGSDLFDARYLGIFLHHQGDFPNVLPGGGETARRVAALMAEMFREFSQALPEYGLIVKAQLLMLLGLLGREFSGVLLPASPTSTARLGQLDHALRYINANLDSSLTLEQIASAAGMSISHFSTVFKDMNGVTVWDYVTRKRIDLAKQYLREGVLTVTEISGLCGFNTIASFNRSFKLIALCTPSAYRKSWLSEDREKGGPHPGSAQ